jgi:hypothetical protein
MDDVSGISSTNVKYNRNTQNKFVLLSYSESYVLLQVEARQAKPGLCGVWEGRSATAAGRHSHACAERRKLTR